jgi:hypothetical protein
VYRRQQAPKYVEGEIVQTAMQQRRPFFFIPVVTNVNRHVTWRRFFFLQSSNNIPIVSKYCHLWDLQVIQKCNEVVRNGLVAIHFIAFWSTLVFEMAIIVKRSSPSFSSVPEAIPFLRTREDLVQ